MNVGTSPMRQTAPVSQTGRPLVPVPHLSRDISHLDISHHHEGTGTSGLLVSVV
jgi:hypothetical protein